MTLLHCLRRVVYHPQDKLTACQVGKQILKTTSLVQGHDILYSLQVRPGQVLEIGGRLLQVMKANHTQGAGRQLGNVQVMPPPPMH